MLTITTLNASLNLHLSGLKTSVPAGKSKQSDFVSIAECRIFALCYNLMDIRQTDEYSFHAQYEH